MSADERRPAVTTVAAARAAVRARPGGVAAILLALVLLVALLPLGRVVRADEWFPLAALVIVSVVVTGYLMRRLTGSTAGAVIAQCAVAAVAVWTGLARAIGLGVPTLGSTAGGIDAIRAALGDGITEIREGVAPLAPSPGTTALIVIALALLTVALDVLVCRYRAALVAVLAALALALAPGLVLPSEIDVVVTLVVFALSVALLATSREANVVVRTRRNAVAVLATSLAAIAAFAITPMVPTSAGAGTGMAGVGLTQRIDSTVDLGRDLRRPRETPVLEYRSDANTPLYLRLATMTGFSGRQWIPDQSPAASLDWLRTTPSAVASGVAVAEHRVDVATASVSADLLPVPAEATQIDGVRGQWQVRQGARTVFSHNSDARDQAYSARFRAVAPTQEQLRAATSTGADLRPGNLELPDDVPAIVTTRLQEATEGADTAFDKLLALQDWFRSPSFSYSLDAPVDQGYDGTGLEAMARFLETGQGYCVHFASTFTVMARELGLPARMVLGFLPGEDSGRATDEEKVYEVSSADLHTWPEVYFDGIGWVAFEPTPSIASAASFAADTENEAAPSASAAPSPQPTTSASVAPASPNSRIDIDAGASGGSSGPVLDLRALLTTAVIVAVLAVPGLTRVALRRHRYRAARRGDPQAAWQEVVSSAIDLGIPLAESASVRRVTESLSEQGRALSRLRDALERNAYRATGQPVSGQDVVDMVEDTRGTWTRSQPWWRQFLAVAAPRSLWHRRAPRPFAPGPDERAWSRPPAHTR